MFTQQLTRHRRSSVRSLHKHNCWWCLLEVPLTNLTFEQFSKKNTLIFFSLKKVAFSGALMTYNFNIFFPKLYVIEDAAEAFMSKRKNKYLGTFGDVGCFSFAPNKIITTGQGGLIVTNNVTIYKELIKLKDQGRVGPTTGGEDVYDTVGYNFKFTNLQSALGLAQLRKLNNRINILKNNYKFYEKNLKQNKNIRLFDFDLKNGELPLWIDAYCLKRNKLFNFLRKQVINSRYFWHPLNVTKPFKQSFSGLNNSKFYYGKLMWLPSSLTLKKRDLTKICNAINKFYSYN